MILRGELSPKILRKGDLGPNLQPPFRGFLRVSKKNPEKSPPRGKRLPIEEGGINPPKIWRHTRGGAQEKEPPGGGGETPRGVPQP